MRPIGEALNSLVPNAQWVVRGETYAGIEWLSADIEMPSEDAITAERIRLQGEYDGQEYARKRAKEYPPITDYIDGVVKGDQAQINAYIAACQAVKSKYPKPE